MRADRALLLAGVVVYASHALAAQRKVSLTMRAHRGRTSQHSMRRKMIRLWRAITGAADGIVTELHKLIETLRADLHYRRWWWSR